MDHVRKYPQRIYFWLVRDEVTGKVRKTRWRMSDDDAARYPDAVRIESDYMEITGPSGNTGWTTQTKEK